MYTPKSFCFSNKTKQKEFVTDTPSPNVEYCYTSVQHKIFNPKWELSNEILYQDFPQGASEWPKDKVLDF